MSLKQQRPRGFSLMEILVAFALLLLTSVAVYSMLSVGMKATRQSGSITEAVNFGRHLMELIRVRNLPFTQGQVPPSESSGLNDRPVTRRALSAAPFGDSDFDGLPEASRFQRNIQMARLGRNRSSFDYNLMKIKVTLYWTENDMERKVELSTLHRQP